MRPGSLATKGERNSRYKYCHKHNKSMLTREIIENELADIKNTIKLFVCPSKILHKHCFYFLLGLTTVPRETGNNAYANFGGTNKEYYAIFDIG